MSTPDPKTVREIAQDALVIAIRRGATEAVETALITHGGGGPVVGEKFDIYTNAVAAEYDRRAAALARPDEQQPADVVTAEVKCGRECSEMHTYEPGSCEAAVTAEQQQDGAVGDPHDWDPVYAAATIDRLQKQLAAATARVEKAAAEVADAEMRADKFCGAFSDAGSLAYRRGKLLDAALTRQTELAKERDEARELARASLEILRNVSDEPMRELFEVDDMGEMPAWFTGYGKPSDAKGADAPPDGRGELVERSETSGGIGTASNSSAGAAGLSERCPCGCPKIGDGCNCRYCNEPYPTRQPNDDTTEDGR